MSDDHKMGHLLLLGWLVQRLVAPTVSAWDSLYNLYLIFGVSAGTFVIGWMVYNVVRYRAKEPVRPGPLEGRNERHSNRGAVLTAALTSTILLIAAIASFQVIGFYYNPPLNTPHMEITVHAFQWGWNFTYPDGYSTLDALYVPVNTTIILNVTSIDVFHSLGIPMFRVKADAIPGQWNMLWFSATQVGNFTEAIRCYELCGVGHADMVANLYVLGQPAFSSWYSEHGGKPNGA
ncbi:MAG: cytochrome c oxidase subunit II [Thermoprotei archaeon]